MLDLRLKIELHELMFKIYRTSDNKVADLIIKCSFSCRDRKIKRLPG